MCLFGIQPKFFSIHALNQAIIKNQAFKTFPWFCGKCTRDISGNNLHDLPVHHKDYFTKKTAPWQQLGVVMHLLPLNNEHHPCLDTVWIPNEISVGKRGQ